MSAPTSNRLPWVRIGVEGVVIVVSILLAFGIDAWWDGRQDARRARDYASGLLEDARTNLDRLERSRSEAERQLEAAGTLGEWLKGGDDGADPDDVLTLLVASFAVARFTPTTQGYDQVIAGGDLGLLLSDVRSAIAVWNEAWLRYENTQEQSQSDRHQTYVPFLVEEISLRRAFSVSAEIRDASFGESMFPPAVERLRGNRRLDNLLTYRTVFIQEQLNLYEEMRDALVALMAALR